jgi:hypothetical protein
MDNIGSGSEKQIDESFKLQDRLAVYNKALSETGADNCKFSFISRRFFTPAGQEITQRRSLS